MRTKTLFPVAANYDTRFDVLVVCLHVFIAAIFFSPFFISGAVLIGSTDSLTIKLPMLLGARADLLHGYLPYWDRFTNSGSSLLLCSTCPAAYNPENWIYLLAPPDHVMGVMTFVYFLKFAAYGVVSYFLFKEEFRSKRWALFTSLIVILSGRSIWSITTLENSTALLTVWIALLLFWTIHKRPLWLSYLLLATDLTLLALAPTANAAGYWFVVIGLMFLYRLATQKTPLSHTLAVAGAALATAGCIYLARVVPLLIDLFQIGGGRPMGVNFQDETRYALRLFVPEALGANYHISAHLSSFLKQNGQIDAKFRSYFGIVPVLLIWAMPFVATRKLNGKLVFWLLYCVVALVLNTYIEPFETIARFFLGPIFHPSSIDSFMPIGFAFLAGYSGLVIARAGSHGFTRYFAHVYVVVVLTTVLYIFAIGEIWLFHAAAFNIHLPVSWRLLTQALAATVLVIVALGITTYRWWMPWLSRTWQYLLVGLALFVSATALTVSIQIKTGFLHYVSSINMLATSLLLLIALALAYPFLSRRTSYWRNGMFRWIAPVLILTSLVTIVYPWVTYAATPINLPLSAFVTLLSTSKFILLSAFFFVILCSLRGGHLRGNTFWVLCTALLLVDQIPAAKINSFRVLNPFYYGDGLYPAPPPTQTTSGSLFAPDFNNYRMNHVAGYARIPIFKELYGRYEPLADLGYLYRIPSYSGMAQAISQRYYKLHLASLSDGQHTSGRRSVPANVESDRFLDLVGARYSYLADKERVQIRPTALSRFMLFKHFATLPDQEAPDRLFSPSFNPQNTVLLSTLSENISASSELRPSLGTANLKRNNDAAWHSDPKSPFPQWIRRNYNIPFQANRLTIAPQLTSYPNGTEFQRAPSDFSLQASHDGDTWNTLFQRHNVRYDQTAQPKHWNFENSESYRHYRLLIHRTLNGEPLVTVRRFELEHYETAPTNPTPAQKLAYSGQNAGEINLDVTADARSVLLFNDTYHYGWTAYIDGSPAPILHANYAFMALYIQKGVHHIEFRFKPRSLSWSNRLFMGGGLVFGLSLGGIIVLSRNKRYLKQRRSAKT